MTNALALLYLCAAPVPGFGEHDYRRLWKYAGALALLDPARLERFFQAMTQRGYAPGWDSDAGGVSRWGYRDRLEALRPSAGR